MTTNATASAAEEPDVPTVDDVEFYRHHGYWISPVIIPDEVLDAAERGMARFYRGDLDSTGVHPKDWTPIVAAGLRKDDYASFCVEELGQLVRYPSIGSTAGRLSGADGIRLWHDQLLYKPVDRGSLQANVGWHTDRQYWMSCTSAEMLTAWVPFHDVGPENGSVSFFDASHGWDVTGLDFFSQDLASLERVARDQGFTPAVTPTTMKRGQVSFHHCRTVHGSGPNRGTAPRRSIAIHLQPVDNHPLVGDDGRVAAHRNTELARQVDGLPDFGDESMFPLLWTHESP